MPSRKLAAGFIAAITGLLVSTAHAQQHHPFVEPGLFNPDLQFFAPADISTYSGQPNPNLGWWFRYDRVYVAVSRPESSSAAVENPNGNALQFGFSAPWEMDRTWGNLFEVGYMTEDDTGWMFTWWHIDGPNHGDLGDVLNQGTAPFGLIQLDNLMQGGNQQNMVTAPLVFEPLYQFRTLDQEFDADMVSAEVNKVWRLDPLHNGGILEPMIGIRYVRFQDFGLDFSPIDTDDDNDPMTAPVYTDNNLFTQYTNNHILGGQLGIRWFKETGHWMLSTNARFTAGQNWQSIERRSYTQPIGLENDGTENDLDQNPQTNTDGGAIDAAQPQPPATRTTNVVSEENFSNSELALLTELRAEVAYMVTRDISVNVGGTLMYFGRGLTRVDTDPVIGGLGLQNTILSNIPLPQLDQDALIFGVHMGVLINR